MNRQGRSPHTRHGGGSTGKTNKDKTTASPGRTPPLPSSSSQHTGNESPSLVLGPLGPRWSSGELDAFFHAFRRCGEHWEALAARLPQRTATMVEALYRAHKGYLSLPDASAAHFCQIASDFQASAQEAAGSPDTAWGTPKTFSSTSSRKKKKKKSASSSPSTPLSIKKSHKKKTPAAHPPSSRDSWHTASPSRLKSPLSAPPPSKRRRSRRLFDDLHSPRRVVPVRERRRKPCVTTGLSMRSTGSFLRFSDGTSPLKQDTTPTSTPSTPPPESSLPPKLRGKRGRGRESFTPSPPSTCRHVAGNGLYSRLHMQLLHFLSWRGLKWVKCEFFYPGIDKVLFRNEFQECLQEIGLGHITKLTRTEWSCLRSSIGRPRRLSRRFLSDERTRLERDRERVRTALVMRSSKPQAERALRDFPPFLNVGRHVAAIHPRSGEVCTGHILTVEPGWHDFRIQFSQPDLGTELVADTDVMPQSSLDALCAKRPKTAGPPEDYTAFPKPGAVMGTSASASPYAGCLEDDLPALAGLIRLLERKERLVAELRAMNDEGETSGSHSSLFQKQYAWLILQLESLNRALETYTTRMRTRVRASMARGIAAGPSDPWCHHAAEAVLADTRGTVQSLQRELEQQHVVEETEMESGVTIGPTEIDRKRVNELVSACYSLVQAVRACSGRASAPSEVDAALDNAVAFLRPRASCNMPLYQDIENSVAALKAVLCASRFQPLVT